MRVEALLKTSLVVLLLSAVLAAPGVSAQEITKPIRYTWIATSCEAWNCAAAALVLANGDKGVIVLPTNVDSRPWVILRRVEEGSIYIPDDEPFGCEVFSTVSEATSHFDAMDTCRAPLIVNVPDGRALVTSLNQCSAQKRRAAR